MYRCKECGTEYETKPDYCDCGNDEFEIFVAPEKKDEIPAPKQNSEPKQIRTPQPKVSKPKKDYSELNRLKEFFDPVSTAIFLFCIISSILVLMFVGNVEQKTKTEPEKTETVNIPPIDSFWDNSIAAIKQPQPEQNQPKKTETESFLQKIIVAPVQKITKPETPKIQIAKNTPKQQITVQKTKNTQPAKTATPSYSTVKVNQPALVQNTTSNKVQQTKTAQAVKTTQTTKTTPAADYSTLTQRVQTNAQNSVTQSQTKATAMNNSQSSTNQTTQNSIAKQLTPQSVQQMPVIKAINPTDAHASVKRLEPDSTTLKQELASYKISLRNTIGKKINFSNVVGDGNCVVSFKISSDGTLINREFSQKSSNITLNDAVYSAINSTPKFQKPPAGYKNETLHLKINFYNGNFDVSLY